MSAIGIFDSGVGGLTVMRQIREQLPHEDILYFGDTARVPYGNKSPETIRRYALESALFLKQKKIKLLVIACNTASAWAADFVQSHLDIPVIEVIQPTVAHALQTTKTGRVAVIGTRATIQSNVYQKALLSALPTVQVFEAACPLLVPLVEEQFFDHAATEMIINNYLAPLKAQKPDTLILGCTHYPLLAPLFQKLLSSDVVLIDAALACAQTVKEKLEKLKLTNPPSHQGRCLFFVSDDAEKFKATGEHFFNHPISHVELV